MNRRVLVLAACAVLIPVLYVTFGGGGGSAGSPSRGRATPRPVKAGASAAPAASARSGYDNFKLIHTRNVFDPDRRPVRTGPPPATPPPARTDYVALTGTFFDGDSKQLAFFSGTRPEYNKVLSVREKIAGATINKITGSNVEVVRNGRPITVAVGQTLPFDNSAPVAAPNPEAAAAPGTPDGGPAAPPGGNPAVASSNPAAPGASPGVLPVSPNAPSSSKQDEVRRRMEERRRQEQK